MKRIIKKKFSLFYLAWWRISNELCVCCVCHNFAPNTTLQCACSRNPKKKKRNICHHFKYATIKLWAKTVIEWTIEMMCFFLLLLKFACELNVLLQNDCFSQFSFLSASLFFSRLLLFMCSQAVDINAHSNAINSVIS